MGGNGEFTRVLMLDLWLRELSFGGAFPIPYRLQGESAVLMRGAKVYTWTHLPLTEVPLHVLMRLGADEPAVVSDAGKIVDDNQFLVFGWEKRVTALPADGGLLRRVRGVLRAGQPVVFLADHFLGGPLSDIPLRVAAGLRVPLIFQWADLLPDGTLDVTFQLAPFPYSENEEQLAANLEFLRERNRAALEKLGWPR